MAATHFVIGGAVVAVPAEVEAEGQTAIDTWYADQTKAVKAVNPPKGKE